MTKSPENEHLPKHVAIIMDGNGRWAKQRGLPRGEGHKQGAKVFKRICDVLRLFHGKLAQTARGSQRHNGSFP